MASSVSIPADSHYIKPPISVLLLLLDTKRESRSVMGQG